MKLFLKGNEAVVIGALLANCKSFYGYPITPASEIAHAAAKYFPLLNRTFVQAESEVASINMVYGASAAGERTMTASSGPGISLMSEAISYIAAGSLPCLIVDIMRAGPGLGNIGPEQSDYNQVTKGGGHGDYNCLVLAPNSVQEMLDFAIKGFDLADKYLTPVIIAADGVIGQMMEPVTIPDPVTEKIKKIWALDGTENALQNLHSTIYLDFDELEIHNNQLQEKLSNINKESQLYESYKTDDADILCIGYGIVSRQLMSLVDKAREKGKKVGLLRPITLWPFPQQALLKIGKNLKKIIVAEMSVGQMYNDIERITGGNIPMKLFYRLGGNLPDMDKILEEILNS